MALAGIPSRLPVARRPVAPGRHGYEASHQPATVEGGDVHVLGNGAVLVGMGERTTPTAVEILAQALFASDQATMVIAAELPSSTR